MEEWVQARYLTTTGEVLVFTDYEVSNNGQVRNKKTGKVLSIGHFKNGYCIVHPCINSKMKTCYLHRLVLSSFTDNKDYSLQVNHIDENKDNNCLTNLEWMTAKENTVYSQAKPVLQYDKNGNFIREWHSIRGVKGQFGMNPSSICRCCNGKQKYAGGFIWCYKDV